MNAQLEQYQQMILNEREWSWAVIALICFIAALLIRSWFLKPLVSDAKKLNHRSYQEIKAAYIKRSIWGWLFLFIAIGITSFLWIQPVSFPLEFKESILILGGIVALGLFILFHLVAFGVAALSTMKKSEDDQKIV